MADAPDQHKSDPAKGSQANHVKSLHELSSVAKTTGFHDIANAADRAIDAAQRAVDAYSSGDLAKQRAATADLLRAHADGIIADANRGPMPKELEKAARKTMKFLGKAMQDSSGSDEPV